MRHQLVKLPTQLLPNLVNNKNRDIYIFPFYPALGFTNRGNKLTISEKLFNSIIAGNKPVILKWLGSEDGLTWALNVDNPRTIQSKRNIKIGEYFTVRITTSNLAVVFQNKSSGFTTTQGDQISFIEQSVVKKINFQTTTNFFFGEEKLRVIDTNYIRLFFIVPEIGGNDVLYIENLILHLDENQKFHHFEGTFTSLGDTLRTVGRTLEGLINFSEPGGMTPQPFIASEQRILNTEAEIVEYEAKYNEKYNPLFYKKDIEFEKKYNLPGRTKKVYINSAILFATPGVKYLKIEFNGLFLIGGISVFGRVKTDNNPHINRTKQLFFSQIDKPKDSIGAQEFAVLPVKLVHKSWFLDWKEEYGYFFDPLKARNSEGVIEVSTTGFEDSKKIFRMDEKEPKPISLSGEAFSRFSKNTTYKFYPKKRFTDSQIKLKIKKPDGNFVNFNESIEINATFTSILNTLTFWNIKNSTLDFNGKKISNNKGFAQKILSNIFSVIGGIAGFIAGIKTTAGAASGKTAAIGASLGTLIGDQIGKTIFEWIPDGTFTSEIEYLKKTKSQISLIFPQDFWLHIRNKLPTINGFKNIPFALLNDTQNNFLGGMMNTKIFNSSFVFELTDQLFHKTKVIDALDLLDGSKNVDFNGTPIIGIKNDKTFEIDLINIQGLGKIPMRISFLDKNKNLICESTILPQSGFTGRLNEWETTIIYSDFHHSDLEAAEKYRLPALRDKPPTAVETEIMMTQSEYEDWIRPITPPTPTPTPPPSRPPPSPRPEPTTPIIVDNIPATTADEDNANIKKAEAIRYLNNLDIFKPLYHFFFKSFTRQNQKKEKVYYNAFDPYGWYFDLIWDNISSEQYTFLLKTPSLIDTKIKEYLKRQSVSQSKIWEVLFDTFNFKHIGLKFKFTINFKIGSLDTYKEERIIEGYYEIFFKNGIYIPTNDTKFDNELYNWSWKSKTEINYLHPQIMMNTGYLTTFYANSQLKFINLYPILTLNFNKGEVKIKFKIFKAKGWIQAVDSNWIDESKNFQVKLRIELIETIISSV